MCCKTGIDFTKRLEQANQAKMEDGYVLIRYLGTHSGKKSIRLGRRHYDFSKTVDERAVTPEEAAHALGLTFKKPRAGEPKFELVNPDALSTEDSSEPDPPTPLTDAAETVTVSSIKEGEPTTTAVVDVEQYPEGTETTPTGTTADNPEGGSEPSGDEGSDETFTQVANAQENASPAAIKEANAAGLRLAELNITDRKITVKDVRAALEAKKNA